MYEISSIEVPVKDRRKGLCSLVMEAIVREADRRGLWLGVHVCPEGYPKKEGSKEIADGLLRVCDRYGFESLKIRGEIYRNDKTRKPKKVGGKDA